MVTDEQIKQLAVKIKGGSYNRPEHVRVPTVWARFEGKTPRADGTVPKFRVQDITEEWIEEIVECVPRFLTDVMGENALKAAGPDLNIRFNSAFWREVMKDHVALMCLTDDEEKPRLAGFQMNGIETRLRTEEDCFIDVDGLKQVSRSWVYMATIRRNADVFKKFNISEYLDAFALFVKEEFRNQGLGFQIQKAKIPLAKALGIKLIANAYASDIASHIGGKVGLELICQMPLKEVLNTAAGASDLSQEVPDTSQYFSFRGMTV